MRIFVPSDDLEAGKDGDNGLAVLGEAGLVHEKDVNPGHAQEQVLHYGKVVVAPAQKKSLIQKTVMWIRIWIQLFISMRIHVDSDPDPG